jgi:hypothetical protein
MTLHDGRTGAWGVYGLRTHIERFLLRDWKRREARARKSTRLQEQP